MADLRIYIWEGGRISYGYHDDGTLVVLAESPEQAREVAIASSTIMPQPEDYWERGDIWRDGDGSDETVRAAIARAPDRVLDLDAARVVAFNGGGYD